MHRDVCKENEGLSVTALPDEHSGSSTASVLDVTHLRFCLVSKFSLNCKLFSTSGQIVWEHEVLAVCSLKSAHPINFQ